MLKSIAMARNEMSAQQNKKTRRATNADNIVSNLIDFLGDD